MADQHVAERRVGDASDVAELSNEYDLHSELGRGGSAVVYRASDRALGRDVAIKVVHPRAAAPGDDPVARLAREARTVAQLQHPNIVTVYAVRRLRSGGLALVMQLVPGRTLKQVIQHDGPLPADRVERLVRDVAQALAYAHARGVVHRDVKPENIFVEDDAGRALLADFGIARSDEHESMTLTGTAVGTPFYMSPEQVEGAAVDGRSDLYSLGLVAWEMLTARRPWDGESLYSVIYKQKHEELPPVEALRSGVPLRLQYLVERMLQKRPGARWAGADGLLAQLGHAVLPSDYGRWQSALRRRVERHRATEREGARARPGGGAPVPGSATMRFVRPATAGALHADAAASRDAVTTAIAVGRTRVDEPTGASPPDVSEPIEAPAPIAELDPVHYDDLAEPTWAGGDGEQHPYTHRPVRFAGLAVLALSLVAGAAYGGRGLLRPSTPTAPRPTKATASPPAARVPVTAAPAAGDAPSDAHPPAGVRAFPIGRSAAVLTAGGRHACVVTSGAALWCWGANASGQLGDASDVSRPRPARVVGDLAYTHVAAGAAHTCAVTADADAYCWGSDARGQLGDGTTVRRVAPVRVAGSERFATVASGGAHTCALTRRAGVVCWGANEHGQLGDGSAAAYRTVPGAVHIGDGGPVTAIAVGGTHACAAGADGRAYCWGANDAGQLGDGSRTPRRVPAAVSGGLRFRALAAGSQHTCGVTTDRRVACWGRNRQLELGTREPPERGLAPVVVPLPAAFTAASVALGAGHGCALGTDGAAWCWGRNEAGQLGTGVRGVSAPPARLPVAAPLAAVAASTSHTCALTAAGGVLCWGANREGQLGDSTRIARARPTPVRLAPYVVALPPGGP